MSGSWVGRPSWMTAGVGGVEAGRSRPRASSSHARDPRNVPTSTRPTPACRRCTDVRSVRGLRRGHQFGWTTCTFPHATGGVSELDHGWRGHPAERRRCAPRGDHRHGGPGARLGRRHRRRACGSPIEDAIDADMVDGDYGNVVDAVVLWWRDDDGDLVDALVDSLTDLVGRRRDLAAHPEGRPTRRRGPVRRHRGGADRRALADHHRRGQQGLDRHRLVAPKSTR